MDSDALRAWLAVLDQLTFYELFQVDPRSTFDDIHAAFLRFASDFHPDGHAARVESERAMIERIFRRANEAYRVLSSPDLRARYDGIIGRGPQPSPSQVMQAVQPAQGNQSAQSTQQAHRPSTPPPSTRTGPISIRAAALARAASIAPPASTRSPGVAIDAEAAKIAKVAAVRASNVPPPATLLDKVRNSGARPFVIRAEQLVKSGDPRQARIQLVLAMHMDANNPALEEYLKQVEALIAGGRRK